MNKTPKILCNLLAFLLITCYTGLDQVDKGQTKHPPPSPVRASFYAPKFEGRLMANGHRFHSNVISAASLAFPLGTKVKVTNVRTGKSLSVTITDRGPWSKHFRIDLSPAAFRALGLSKKKGWGWVTVEKVTT